MKKSFLRGFLSVSLVLFSFAVFALLSGCQAEQSLPVYVSVVLGAHANSKNLNLSNKSVSDILFEAVRSYGQISVICADGKPEIYGTKSFDIADRYKGAAVKKLDKDAQTKTRALMSSLSDVKADDPELDTLKTLQVAARSLASAPPGAKKYLIVYDTGLSTTGLLDFRNNILDAEPAEVAEKLTEKNAVPDFTGIDVRWEQCGEAGAPQQELTGTQILQLKAIWKAVVEKGGGVWIESKENAAAGDIPADGYPKISTVPLTAESSIRFDPKKTTVYSEKEIRFVGDSAVFADPQAANLSLTPAAEYFKANPGFKGLLAGTTAGVNDLAYCMKLSLARADAVRTALVSLGASENQLITVGLADKDPWHIADRDGSGNLIEAIAAQNRKVVLIDASSNIARDILNR